MEYSRGIYKKTLSVQTHVTQHRVPRQAKRFNGCPPTQRPPSRRAGAPGGAESKPPHRIRIYNRLLAHGETGKGREKVHIIADVPDPVSRGQSGGNMFALHAGDETGGGSGSGNAATGTRTPGVMGKGRRKKRSCQLHLPLHFWHGDAFPFLRHLSLGCCRPREYFRGLLLSQ